MASQITMTSPTSTGPGPDGTGPAGGEAATRTEGAHPASDLVAGIQLLRAANLQTVRLQLAMARQERRSAMESLDRLAEMDRELERCLDGFEPAGPGVDEIKRLVAAQKSALADEKIALMAEISGPRVASARPLHRPAQLHSADEPAAAPESLQNPDEPEEEEAPAKIIVASAQGPIEQSADTRAGRSTWKMALAIVMFAILIGAAATAGWLIHSQPALAAAMGREVAATVSSWIERLPLP